MEQSCKSVLLLGGFVLFPLSDSKTALAGAGPAVPDKLSVAKYATNDYTPGTSRVFGPRAEVCY